MTNNRHAYVNLYPSVDAVTEFKVYTGNAEANMACSRYALVTSISS